MSKKVWAGIICGTLFPPLLIIPLVYYFIILPLKEGVIRGSRLIYYVWATSVLSISSILILPVKNITDNIFLLNNIETTRNYILGSLLASFVGIFMIFRSTRNEPDQKQFLRVEKFKIDKLFLICFAITFLPYLGAFSTKYSFENIAHPSIYAFAFAFFNNNYILAFLGFFSVTVLTGILEESVFRGLLLRDYFGLKPFHQKILLTVSAIYFGSVHLPLYFVGPFIFALFINRIRIAYRNLLPSMTLHALWNANVLIAILISLHFSKEEPIKNSTVEEELIKASFVWEHKDIEFGKRYFKYVKDSDLKGYEKLKGNFLDIMIFPEENDKNKVDMMMVILKKPLSKSKTEYAYGVEDWETRTSKEMNKAKKEVELTYRCSKKIRVCFELKDEKANIILHGPLIPSFY